MAARGQPPGASASHLRALWPELRPALCSCSAPCLRVRGLPGENLAPFTGGGLGLPGTGRTAGTSGLLG